MRLLWIACSHWLKAFALLLILISPIAAAEQLTKPDIPKPRGFINDYANVLDNQSKNKIHTLAFTLEQATGAEMVFVIMKSIAPFDDVTYGMAIFDTWKIGKEGKNNGLLVLLALDEKKLRILTGYGVEGILPDGKLGRYRDDYLIPFLKQGKIGQGLYNIGLAMAQDIANDVGVKLSGTAGSAKPIKKKSDGLAFWLIMLVCILIYTMISRRNYRRRGIYGSAYYGGVYTRGGGGFGGGFSGFGGGFSGGGGIGGSW